MEGWPADDNDSLIAFYGPPGTTLIRFQPPWAMTYTEPPHQPIPAFMLHPKCFAAMDKVFEEIWEVCYHDQREIERHRLHLFGGCYRRCYTCDSFVIWSPHAFGAAIRINPGHPAPNFVIDAFRRQGATWGGDLEKPDPAYFQFARRA